MTPEKNTAGTLADVAHLLEGTDAPSHRIRRVLELLLRVLACDRCALASADGDVPEVSAVPDTAAVDERLGAKLARLLEFVGDRPDGQLARSPITGTGDGRDHLAMPLFAEDRVVGLLLLERDGAPFGEGDLQVLVVVGAQLGAYLANLRLRAQEARAMEELRGALRLSELFVGIVGHDLRNPLAAISNSAEVLVHDCDERMLRPLRRIIGNVRRMTEIIDRLLDFTRIRSGKGLELTCASVDLAGACGHVVEELQDANPGAELTITARGDTTLSCDAARVCQALSNLLGNAVQHGTPGRPIALALDGTDPRFLVLSVHNEGTIPDEVLPTLFDPFQRAQRREHRRAGGLGLGLYVAERIAAAHGGAIEVDSSSERGTTFSVRLPRGS